MRSEQAALEDNLKILEQKVRPGEAGNHSNLVTLVTPVTLVTLVTIITLVTLDLVGGFARYRKQKTSTHALY